MNGHNQPLTRRQFLKASALVAFSAAPNIIPASVLGANAPSNRITIGMIGTGNQGTQDMRAFLSEPDAQVIAVCDVNRGSDGYRNADQFLGREPALKIVQEFYANQQGSGTYRGCKAYTDFRDVIGRTDVDAVAIVVPDHWHAVMTIMAARAGKDIYCEKPLSYTVAEGRAMVDAARQAGVVLQTGSHERSNPVSRNVCAVARSGKLGQIKRILTVVGPWNKFGPVGSWNPMPVPDGFDYDMWLGPAPYEPYHKDRCLYNFRFIGDYSPGQITNYGAHSLDLAQWGMGMDHSGPVEVEDLGTVWPEPGLFTVAKEPHFRARYANGVELECITRKDNVAVRFEGTEGWVQTGYGGFFCEPLSLRPLVLGAQTFRMGGTGGHVRNFLDCIKSRGEPHATGEIGHRSATFCHIANIAMKLGKKLQWDPVAEKFIGNDQANKLLTRANRAPWGV